MEQKPAGRGKAGQGISLPSIPQMREKNGGGADLLTGGIYLTGHALPFTFFYKRSHSCIRRQMQILLSTDVDHTFTAFSDQMAGCHVTALDIIRMDHRKTGKLVIQRHCRNPKLLQKFSAQKM